MLAGICHLSVFFAPVILPLIIWLAMRQSQPYASKQAKQAFFFHLGFTVLTVLGVIGAQVFVFSTMVAAGAVSQDPTAPLAVLPLVFLVYGVIFLVGIVDVVLSVIGAVQAFQGKPFHYPLLGGL